MTSIYTATIFLSALLLFLVQPMITKLLVPVLGGAPAVWNTAMFFFQAVLLLGYLFAHLTHRYLAPRPQSLAHLALLLLSLLWLPLAVAVFDADRVTSPSGWVLGTLALSVGLPFLALSSNGPTLQAWFASSGHRDSRNPYFLYAASNLGSMVALLAYPVVVEPLLGLTRQRLVWSWLYGLLALLLFACAALLWRARPPAVPVAAGPAADGEGLSPLRRASWVLLAFVPSSLLLGTTTYITTDLASVPLLWTIPLALYLLSMVFVFARKPILHPGIGGLLAPLTVALAISLLFEGFQNASAFIVLPLAVLFVASMVCHGRLADDRPSPAHLTEFYFWLSLGGVLGGVFNAILAPMLFDSVWEYPLALVLALMLRPAAADGDSSRQARRMDVLLPSAIGAGMALFALSLERWSGAYLGVLGRLGEELTRGIPALGELGIASASVLMLGFYSVPAAACFVFRKRPVRFALMLGAVLVVGMASPFQTGTTLLYKERNFYGAISVIETTRTGVRAMYHGATLHGLQSGRGSARLGVNSYYSPLVPLWSVLNGGFRRGHVAVVGLGAGMIACAAGPEQRLTFYEINPLVEAMARNTDYFTYLRDCPPRMQVVLGDGRLSLAEAPDGGFGLLVLDAFSSDSVPVHLLTVEAVDLYLEKLAPGGVLAVHISSQHLDFVPVVAALASARGLHAMSLVDDAENAGPLRKPSKWAVLSRKKEVLERLRRLDPRWAPLPPGSVDMLWTDDFSNIFSIIR